MREEKSGNLILNDVMSEEGEVWTVSLSVKNEKGSCRKHCLV